MVAWAIFGFIVWTMVVLVGGFFVGKKHGAKVEKIQARLDEIASASFK